MKTEDLLDAPTSLAVGVVWLRAALEPVSEPGRRAAADWRPFRPGEESAAQERASAIVQFAAAFAAEQLETMCEALRYAPDPFPALSRAAMGDHLEDAHLLELQRFLDAAARIDAVLASAKQTSRLLNEGSSEVSQLLERGRAKFGFYLDDGFDPELSNARRAAERASAEFEAARGRLAQAAARQLGRAGIPHGEFIVMRDAFTTLPPGVRIIRESPTYVLCELELDEHVLEALRRREAASEAVAAAETSVRARLAAEIRERIAALERVAVAFGAFDLLLAQARFAKEHECVVPAIAAGAGLCFDSARYLPLEAELLRDGARYEPISIDLAKPAVLTGPNMGGKSVALRTCGFIAALVTFGLPVPAKSARAALFDEIAWLGIGYEEQNGSLLSSFAREVVRLKELLERPARRALLLVDEFARTTTPHEGKALLTALLCELKQSARLALVATHLAGVAEAAGVTHLAVRGLRGIPHAPPSGDLQDALRALAQSMDYSVFEVGEGGEHSSDAVALAEILGLDSRIVRHAAALLAAGIGE